MHIDQNLELGIQYEEFEDVQILHAELQPLGYEELYPDLRQDIEAGVFGEATRDAVIAFKQTRGLPLDPDPAIACIFNDAKTHSINLTVDALFPLSGCKKQVMIPLTDRRANRSKSLAKIKI